MSRLSWTYVVVSTALVTTIAVWAVPKKMPLPARESLVGVWVGMSEDELYMIRLALAADGSGALSYSFRDDVPRVVKVQSWSLSGRQIHVMLESGPSDTVREATGNASSFALSLLIEGGSWKRRAELRREAELEQRWNKLKQAMAASIQR